MIERIKCGDPRDFCNERCSDCGAIPGEYHLEGCDCERCPICGNQLITCGCMGKIFSYKYSKKEIKDFITFYKKLIKQEKKYNSLFSPVIIERCKKQIQHYQEDLKKWN